MVIKMKKELVSIIVPIYNMEKYIGRTIDSLLKQTYKNIQIICVDDGSTDNSMKILSEYHDERIIIVRKENGGVASARNYGLRCVEGNYIAFVDPDDWVEPEFIATLIKQFTSWDIDISCVPFNYAYDDHVEEYKYKMRKQILSGINALTLLCDGKYLTNHLCNKMYRTYMFSNIRFEEGRKYEDIFVMHQLFMKAKKISISDETMYHYYVRPASITHEDGSKNAADIAIAFISAYDSLSYPFHKFLTLNKCAWASYQVLYLYNKNLFSKNDLMRIRNFWKKHREIVFLGKKYFLMYKKPKYYKEKYLND